MDQVNDIRLLLFWTQLPLYANTYMISYIKYFKMMSSVLLYNAENSQDRDKTSSMSKFFTVYY